MGHSVGLLAGVGRGINPPDCSMALEPELAPCAGWGCPCLGGATLVGPCGDHVVCILLTIVPGRLQ